MGTGPPGSAFGKFVLSRNLGYRTRGGGRQVAKRTSKPWVAYPEVKVLVRDLVRFVGILGIFAPMGVGTRGKLRFLAKTNFPPNTGPVRTGPSTIPTRSGP